MQLTGNQKKERYNLSSKCYDILFIINTDAYKKKNLKFVENQF